MNDPHTPVDDLSNPRLAEVVAAFQAELDEGRTPFRDDYVSRHPEFAGALDGCLRAVEFVRAAARTSAPAGPSSVRGGVGPGDVLGEFRLVREVGRGGMGIVFEAVQEPLGRTVALKVLSAGTHDSPHALARFRREAQTAAKLHHTNIVPVFGVGADRGVSYYAMQFIDGTSLSFAVGDETASLAGRDEPTPRPGDATRRVTPKADRVRAIVAWVIQAGDALDYAHRHGVLHRDIKPSNLLVDGTDNLWVADFGLAKAVESDDLTGTGDLVGTLRYMAPERFAGTCDARADVYGLGATLYELVTGRPLYTESGRLELIHAITHADPPRPRALAPGLAKDLETVLLKATARDPNDRYPTALAFADDLRNVVADRPPAARRPGPVEQLVRWAKRNRRVAALLAFSFSLVSVIAVGGTVQNRSLRVALKDKDEALTSERNARSAESVASREARLRLRDSLIAQARNERTRGYPGQRQSSLELIRKSAELAPSVDARGELISTLSTFDLEPAAIVRQEDERVFRPQFFLSAITGKAGAEGTVRIVKETPLQPTEHRNEIVVRPESRTTLLAERSDREMPLSRRAFNAAGTYVITRDLDPEGPGRVREWKTGRVVTEFPRPRAMNPDGQTPTYSWKPADAGFYVVGHDGLVHDVNLHSPPGPSWAVGPKPTTVALSNDGGYLAVGYDAPDPVIDIFAVNGRNRVSSFKVMESVRSLAWSDSGLWLAAGTKRGHVHFYRRRSHQEPWERFGEIVARDRIGLRQEDIDYLTFDPTDQWCVAKQNNGVLHVLSPWRVSDVIQFNPYEDGMGGSTSSRINPNHQMSLDGQWIGWGSQRRLRCLFPTTYSLLSYGDRNTQIEFGPGGDYLLAWDQSDRRVEHWQVWDVKRAIPVGGGGPVEGKWVGPWDDRSSMREYDLATHRVYRRDFLWRDGRIALANRDVALTSLPDAGALSHFNLTFSSLAGRWAFIARNKSFYTWETHEAHKVIAHPGQTGTFTAFDPKGRFFVVNDRRSLLVRDATTNAILKEIPPPLEINFGFNRDGSILCNYGPSTYRTFRTDTWDQLEMFDRGKPENGLGIAFHPSGSFLALYQHQGIEIRRLRDGQLLARWDFNERMSGMAFDPTGRYLAATGDGTHLWDFTALRVELRKLNLDWDDDPPSGQPN